MSTQPIIIQIVDQVDPTIVAKIQGIGTSARSAAADIRDLQAAIAGLSGNNLSGALRGVSTNLNNIREAAQPAATYFQSLGTVAQTTSVSLGGAVTALGNANIVLPKVAEGAANTARNLRNAAEGSSVFEKAIANLLARAIGAEAGIGRMGGAIGRLGVAAIGAGPLILALFAIGAIVTAVIWYEKAEEAARKLTLAQIGLAEGTNKQNDKLLQQRETLIGLVDGPMAKYQAQLEDLSRKSIDLDVEKVNKVLEEQKSKWASIVSWMERYVTLNNAIAAYSMHYTAITPSQPAFSIQDAQNFIHQQELSRQAVEGTNKAVNQFTDSLANSAHTAESEAKSIQDFVASASKAPITTKDQFTSLNNDMAQVLQKIIDLRRETASETGRTREITQVGINALQDYYNELVGKQREYLNTRKTLQMGADGELLSEQKRAASEQLKAFQDELDRFKALSPTGRITAQQELEFRQKQLLGEPRETTLGPPQAAVAFAQPQLLDDISKLTAEIKRQGPEVQNLVDRYKDAIEKTGAYSDALKIQAEVDKLITDINRNGRIPVTTELRQQLTEAVTVEVQQQKVLREETAIYNDLVGPSERYAAALEATNRLLKDHAISAEQAAAADARALRQSQDAIDPLNEYRIGLEHEIGLLNQYGKALQFATEVDRVRQELQKRGYDLTQQQSEALTKLLDQMDKMKQIQADETKLWEENQGAQEKILNQQLALNKAYQDGVITLGEYKVRALDAALAMNQLNNTITGGTFKSNILQIYGGLINEFTTLQNKGHQVTQALDKDFTKFFADLEHGSAQAFARAIVYGENLGKALLDVARHAVAQLISSLIELGIQFLIVEALEKAFGIHLPKSNDQSTAILKNMAVALASIAAVTAAQLIAINMMIGPAWALAEAVSLFSFGANAPPAEAGIAAVVAAGEAARVSGMFAEGGMIKGPGTGRSDDVLIWASNGEFVVNADATAKNRSLLQSINKGDDIVKMQTTEAKTFAISLSEMPTAKGLKSHLMKYADGGLIGDAWMLPAYADGGMIDTGSLNTGRDAVRAVSGERYGNTQVQMKVNVIHDGSTGVRVEQLDAQTIRVIARQEAKVAVQEQAPGIIATDLRNPNSKTSKAVQQNVVAPRRR